MTQHQAHEEPPPDHQSRRRFYSMPRERRDTHRSRDSRRTTSFPQMAEDAREARRTKKYQQQYSVYNGLTWDTLYRYLSEKWPNEYFTEQRKGDFWVFETPEPLTDADKREIAKLRDSDQRRQNGQRASQSPEPERN